MTDISVSGLYKSFGPDRMVLNGLSFDVYEGEKVGLLGKNGAGKTTLFKILEGTLSCDAGSAAVPCGKRLGLLSQIPVYPEGFATDDVLKTAFERLFAMRAELRELEERMKTDASAAVLSRYGALSHAYEAEGGYECDTRAAKVCNGLAVSEKMRAQPFSSLSGGEQTRVNLARLILMDTDILLLDEPTNHLDLNSVEWLEEFLLKYRGTCLIISHDRYFLDRVVSRIVELRDGKAEFYDGNYSFYVKEKEARYLLSLSRYEQEQRKISQLEAAAQRMHTWAQGHDNPALHKRAFAMERRVERLRKTDRPQKERALTARFREAEFRGDEVLRAQGLSMSFGGRTLFSGLDLEIENGERIGLIGDNGSGKTTLLNILDGELSPDAGRVRLGPSVKPAYMRQNVTFPHPERSLVDTLLYALGCSPQTARNRLGLFHFSGEDALKRVADLSGGERSRLMLCILMASDISFLMLDEPTNHMDVGAREWIEEIVTDFSGTLLFVSHDRYFISRFATRIWEFENGRVYDFRGTYEQYRAYRQRERELKEISRASAPKRKKKKEEKKPEAGLADRLEGEIARLEDRVGEIENEMGRCPSDYGKLDGLFQEKARTEEQLAALYNEWEKTLEK